MNTNRNEHAEWTDQLSAFLDGELSSDELRAVEEHLAECGACRLVLEELRNVVAQAGSLGGIEPPRELWGGIAATIQAPAPTPVHEAKVIELRTAAEDQRRVEAHGGPAGERRLSFSTPQLIAASVALIAASSLATWAAGPGLGVQPGGRDGAGVTADGVVSMASDASLTPPAGLADELVVLEEALSQARAALDPNTVRVLERNLDVIEQAIEDSQRALLQDPGNEFLAEHLDRVYQRKLTYLRDATRVAEWSS